VDLPLVAHVDDVLRPVGDARADDHWRVRLRPDVVGDPAADWTIRRPHPPSASSPRKP
jgi:hypothetical protein